MSCIRPWAPFGETAWGLKPDSTDTTASTRAGSRPCRRADSSIRRESAAPARRAQDLLQHLVRHEPAHRLRRQVHFPAALQHQRQKLALGAVAVELQRLPAREQRDLRARERRSRRERAEGENDGQAPDHASLNR